MKRLSAILLAMMTLFLSMSVAFAQGGTYTRSYGTVTAVNTEESVLSVQTGGGTNTTIKLDILDSTKIVDNTTHKQLQLSDIQVGTTVYVWHTAGQSTFVPPHRKAYAVVANVAADQAAGQLFEIASISKGENGYTLFNAEGDLYLTIPSASIPVYGQSEKLSASKLKPGMVLLAWYDVVLESYPGQASSDTLLMLSTSASVQPPQTGDSSAMNLLFAGLSFMVSIGAAALLVRRCRMGRT